MSEATTAAQLLDWHATLLLLERPMMYPSANVIFLMSVLLKIDGLYCPQLRTASTGCDEIKSFEKVKKSQDSALVRRSCAPASN